MHGVAGRTARYRAAVAGMAGNATTDLTLRITATLPQAQFMASISLSALLQKLSIVLPADSARLSFAMRTTRWR